VTSQTGKTVSRPVSEIVLPGQTEGACPPQPVNSASCVPPLDPGWIPESTVGTTVRSAETKTGRAVFQRTLPIMML
jgi:hypothetical protein